MLVSVPVSISEAQSPQPRWNAASECVCGKVEVEDLSLFYGTFQALRNVSISIPECAVLALIGPSGCGKSSFLRCINRLNDLIPGARTTGRVLLDGKNVYDPDVDAFLLRKRVGMVFQQPNPFPKSIFENVAYGPRIHGVKNKSELADIVERSLRRAALWDEVKDDVYKPALALSGGQQQRLCIARALAVEPEILLMDEPCSALDPISTGRIEELICSLKEDYTIVIVTHNMQQASRISDYTGFFLMGELIEFGESAQIFTRPKDKRTEDYVTGRFG
ncbi:MAG: phosphate ABC transporter ATP-binding protein PstB [Armatimonadota bacterium]|nr:phosphate ABC transporter ATP-binding protein PstB [Armatimonadota bacterium]